MADDGNNPFPAADVLLIDNIQTIAQSPFGKTHRGQKIVRALEICRQNKKISFEKMSDEARGGEVTGEISINARFYQNKPGTILELVHEGTHALHFFQRNPDFRYDKPRNGKPESQADHVTDEAESQTNQLEIYLWLKTQFIGYEDSEMEERLKNADTPGPINTGKTKPPQPKIIEIAPLR